MKGLRTAAGIVNAIGLLLVLLYFAVQLPTFSLWFYEHEYEKNSTYEQVSMKKEDLHAVTKHMIDYMRGKEEMLNIETTVAGAPRLFFSDEEIIHMEDVLLLFDAGRLLRNIGAACFLLTAVFLSLCGKDGLSSGMKAWRGAAFGVLGGAALLGALIGIGFDKAFTIFHEIFFAGKVWQFDARTNLLVNIVPTPFFIDIAICIGVVFALSLVVMGTTAAVALRGLRTQGEGKA